MGQLLLFVVVALVVAAIVFGVTVMVSGGDSGLTPVEPDGRALPLPSDRPLGEEDVIRTKFDTAFRGYRMAQVDQALQRAAYDIGYKGELIGVLEAEVAALREGRLADADVLRRAREAAIAPPPVAEDPAPGGEPAAGDPVAVVADPPPDVLERRPGDVVSRNGEPAERR
jgi:DivIVA domain-containing protein